MADDAVTRAHGVSAWSFLDAGRVFCSSRGITIWSPRSWESAARSWTDPILSLPALSHPIPARMPPNDRDAAIRSSGSSSERCSRLDSEMFKVARKLLLSCWVATTMSCWSTVRAPVTDQSDQAQPMRSVSRRKYGRGANYLQATPMQQTHHIRTLLSSRPGF